MNNPVLEEIKNSTIAKLTQRYGYCGCADGPNFSMLNSGGENENFIITIKDQSAIDAANEANKKKSPPP